MNKSDPCLSPYLEDMAHIDVWKDWFDIIGIIAGSDVKHDELIASVTKDGGDSKQEDEKEKRLGNLGQHGEAFTSSVIVAVSNAPESL